MTCRYRVAQPGGADADVVPTACGDTAGEAGAEDAGGTADAEDTGADELVADGADVSCDVADTVAAGGAEDSPPAAHPATTAPAAATPANLSSNEIEPVITNHPF